MMKKILVAAVLVFTLCCCEQRKVAREMKAFMETEIRFTDDIFKVKDRNVFQYEVACSRPLMVMYFDSTDCSSCQIGHLQNYIGLFEMADTSGLFGVVFLFSPGEEEYDNVMQQLVMLDFPYPLYIDYGCSFGRENRAIPEDDRYHCFLLGKDGRPVFVGNPLMSHELMDVFRETLERRGNSL